MQLKRLVFPSPFGPMSPTICPSMMSNETLSSAATPPKRRLTSRTESNGSSDTVIRPFDREGASAVDGLSADRCAPLRRTKIHNRWWDDRHCRTHLGPSEGDGLSSLD